VLKAQRLKRKRKTPRQKTLDFDRVPRSAEKAHGLISREMGSSLAESERLGWSVWQCR
jgi:hypothetical protein